MAFELQQVEVDILRALLKKQGGRCIRRSTSKTAYSHRGSGSESLNSILVRTRYRQPPGRLWIDERTIRDFNIRNQHPVLLPEDVLPGDESMFLDQIEPESAFDERIVVSRPGMDRSKTEALVYYEWTCLGDGYGHYYLMRFQYGRWMRVMREIDFIS